MNIDLIRGTLATSDSPGLSPIDPRFNDIATLIQEGHYAEASAGAEEVLKEEIYDIRIMGYFVYGIFLEKGVGALEEIFTAMAGVLRDNLEAVGPARNREKHIQTILTWLMKQLSKKLQYEEDRKTGVWDLWLSEVSSENVQDAMDAVDNFRRAVSQVLEDKAAGVLDGLIKVGDWLKSFEMLVYQEPEPEPEPEEEMVEEEVEVDSVPVQADRGGFSPNDEGMGGIAGSSALSVLVKKIEAFDALISQAKMTQATLVADDINHIIENFDPKVYFPELFASFTLQSALNINGLTAFSAEKQSVEWKALQELYKTDLASFVAFDASAITFTVACEAAAAGGEGGGEYGFGGQAQAEPGFGGDAFSGEDTGGW